MSVSVITITYDDPIGLARTIKSVIDQQCEVEIEHVIVDGAQSESTFQILAAHRSTATVISEPDDGRYDAMNKGIRRSTGDVLWFMHSGDRFSSPSSVSIALSQLGDPRNQWGYGLARLVDSEQRFCGVFGDLSFVRQRFALGGKPVPHQACFFGREIVAKLGEYDLNHGLAADQLFILRASLERQPVVIADFLADFDVTGAGSIRLPFHHYKEMSQSRRKTGISYSGSESIDTILSMALASKAMARFVAARTLQQFLQFRETVSKRGDMLA